ncbi:MAG: TMEM175 family protein [Pirellulaceae bacterium]
MTKIVSDIVQRGDRYFRWRGENVSRLEAIFDALVALSMTLIIVSIEVPKSFDDLWGSFAKLPAFAICFTILMMCWYYNYLFHRRYGLEDFPVVIMNGVQMFLIVLYVYPLKFLYTLMFNRGQIQINQGQIGTLMIMYSCGFLAIFLTYALMYFYAYTKRATLNLNRNEITLTRLKISEHLTYVLVSIVSIVLACFPKLIPWSGIVYAALGPLQFANGFIWGRQIEE